MSFKNVSPVHGHAHGGYSKTVFLLFLDKSDHLYKEVKYHTDIPEWLDTAET